MTVHRRASGDEPTHPTLDVGMMLIPRRSVAIIAVTP